MRAMVGRALVGVLAGAGLVVVGAIPAGAGDSTGQGIGIQIYGPDEVPTTASPPDVAGTTLLPATGVATSPAFTG
jgi:hypothetical protein